MRHSRRWVGSFRSPSIHGVTTESLPRTPAELGLPELPVEARPADPAVHHVRAKLDREIRALLAYEAGTRSGADPEDLHQMRVALRRMRSVLKLSGALVGGCADPGCAELGWVRHSRGGGAGPDSRSARCGTTTS